MAASYGGLGAYRQILGSLPPDFAAPILVIQHRDPRVDVCAKVLSTVTDLPVAIPQEGERPRPGTVYVLPADRQAMFDAEARMRFAEAPRCLADPLLESASFVFRERLVAVILTGRLRDGATGVRAVKRLGGRVLVQDEATAADFGMPGAAAATGCFDFMLPLDYVAPALVSLIMIPGASELFRVRLGPWASVT